MPQFQWTAKKAQAAIALAEGHSQVAVAKTCGIDRTTVQRWLAHPDFRAEVDRLSLMVGIASRAERLRIAQRAIRMRMPDDTIVMSKADILDWLKFAQSETHGVKLDLAALVAAAASLAGSGSSGSVDPASDATEPGD